VNIDAIHWLGHDAFRIDGEATIYFDPWKLKDDAPAADIICISHDHFDHFSEPDVARIMGPKTTVFTTQRVADQMTGDVRVLEPGESGQAHGVTVKAIHAYNKGKSFHPRNDKHIGFLVSTDEFTIYHAGDTDLIPEMKKVKTDVALLPVSGTYVMTPEEAADAAAMIKPKVAIPMHYGEIVGTPEDALRFSVLYEGETRILKREL
jgi:L-ascorbate metabolism protein UlaG (beta-lactamase superfamily)